MSEILCEMDVWVLLVSFTMTYLEGTDKEFQGPEFNASCLQIF